MTKPEWEQDGINRYTWCLTGFEITVWQGALSGKWRMKYGWVTGYWGGINLKAAAAREAQEEALDIVWLRASNLKRAIEAMQEARTQETEK